MAANQVKNKSHAQTMVPSFAVTSRSAATVVGVAGVGVEEVVVAVPAMRFLCFCASAKTVT